MSYVNPTVVRVPALVPAWLHVAYLNGYLTRGEWLMQTRLYEVWRAGWSTRRAAA